MMEPIATESNQPDFVNREEEEGYHGEEDPPKSEEKDIRGLESDEDIGQQNHYGEDSPAKQKIRVAPWSRTKINKPFLIILLLVTLILAICFQTIKTVPQV